MLNYLRSSVFALTVPLILLSLFSNASCKIAVSPTLSVYYIGKRKMEKIME